MTISSIHFSTVHHLGFIRSKPLLNMIQFLQQKRGKEQTKLAPNTNTKLRTMISSSETLMWSVVYTQWRLKKRPLPKQTESSWREFVFPHFSWALPLWPPPISLPTCTPCPNPRIQGEHAWLGFAQLCSFVWQLGETKRRLKQQRVHLD